MSTEAEGQVIERRRGPDGEWQVVRAAEKPKPTGSMRLVDGQLVPYAPRNDLGGPVAKSDPTKPSGPAIPIQDPARIPTVQELMADLEASRGGRRPAPRPRPAPSPAELAGRPGCIPDLSCRPGCLPGWYPGKPAPRSNKEIQADLSANERRKTELLRELQGLPAAS